MPAAIMSTELAAARVEPEAVDAATSTRATTVASASSPQFAAMQTAAGQAPSRNNRRLPDARCPTARRQVARRCGATCSNAMPPPGTMPSSTAARVALIASSISCARRFCSHRRGAARQDHRRAAGRLREPLLQLVALDIRRRQLDWRTTCSRRAAIAVGIAAAGGDHRLVGGNAHLPRASRDRAARPSRSARRGRAAITRPPVAMAMSSSMDLRQWPYSGGWIAATLGAALFVGAAAG